MAENTGNFVISQPTNTPAVPIPDVPNNIDGGTYGKISSTPQREENILFFKDATEVAAAAEAKAGTKLLWLEFDIKALDPTTASRLTDYESYSFTSLRIGGKREDVAWMRSGAVYVVLVDNPWFNPESATNEQRLAYCKRAPQSRRFGMSELIDAELTSFFTPILKQRAYYVNKADDMPLNYVRGGGLLVVLARDNGLVSYNCTISHCGAIRSEGFMPKSMLAKPTKLRVRVPPAEKFQLNPVEPGITDLRMLYTDDYPYDYEGRFYPDEEIRQRQWATSDDDAIQWKEGFDILSQDAGIYHSAADKQTMIVFDTNQGARQTFSEPILADPFKVSNGWALIVDQAVQGNHHKINFNACADLSKPVQPDYASWPSGVWDRLHNKAEVTKPKEDYESVFRAQMRRFIGTEEKADNQPKPALI